MKQNYLATYTALATLLLFLCSSFFFVAGALLCHIIILPDRAKHINPFGKGRIEKRKKRLSKRKRENHRRIMPSAGVTASRCRSLVHHSKAWERKWFLKNYMKNDNRCSFYRKRRPTHYAPFQHYRNKNQHHQLSSRIKRVKWWWWRIVQVENSMSKQKSKLKTKSTGQFWSIDARQSYRGEVSKNQDNAECWILFLLIVESAPAENNYEIRQRRYIMDSKSCDQLSISWLIAANHYLQISRNVKRVKTPPVLFQGPSLPNPTTLGLVQSHFLELDKNHS